LAIPEIDPGVFAISFTFTFIVLKHHFNIGVRRMAWGVGCTVWGVRRGGRQPQAASPVVGLPLEWLYGRFRGGPPAGHKTVGHGDPSDDREFMATPCHTPMHFNISMLHKPVLNITFEKRFLTLIFEDATLFLLDVSFRCCYYMVIDL
jgi:hypothetical protein